ncbi:MAG TPA: peptidoglycan DD-metalloendopeptidase family protein [Anaerolineales bacterium]|nr:peptidoglycan DD-metalloendopeptidase family protein [Anaerolineales bacterium]
MKFLAFPTLPRWLHLSLGLVLLLFAGLSGSHLRIPEPLPLPALPESNPAPAESHTSNHEKVSHSSQLQAGAQPDTVVLNAAEQPLHFVFPDPAPPPVSAWRPALYPIPWALTPFDHFYFSRPIAANEINWPVADYRYGGIFFEDIVHGGVDIPAPVGTPVLAAGSGKVTWAGYGLYYGYEDKTDPYGLAVYIRHDFGFQGYTLYTLYGHLDRVAVVKGQYVQTGDILGESGKTGKVTGPHLHFEVRLEKDSIYSTRNPELWLVPPQGWGVLAGRVMSTGGARLAGQFVMVRSQESGQTWRANSYGRGNVNPDPYYQENLVISDLPAGKYEILINYLGRKYLLEIEIQPGLVSYFSFNGRNGFSQEFPPLPGADFTPLLIP